MNICTTRPLRILAALALLLTAGALGGCSGADATFRGRALGPNGQGRFNVAVIARLRNGEQQTAVTQLDGSYSLRVKRDLLVKLEFIDEILGPVMLENLAALDGQQINVVTMWAPPQTGADYLARLSAIEQLYVRAAMKEELPRLAWVYLTRFAPDHLKALSSSDPPMPSEIKKHFAERLRDLAERLEELEVPPRG
jgi:hypothetical protein